jgi:broad specificity phosphatase PhoE
MEPPAITRHRRPFLAPLWLPLLAVLILAGVGWVLYRSVTTTVFFLVRPAEGPASIADPPMSPEGEERAQHLARIFATGRGAGAIDEVYVSDDRRAQQTAAPLAEQLHHTPPVFKASEAPRAAAGALHEHAGETIVVVASGAALGQIVRELSGIELPAGSAEDNDAIYVVSVPTIGRAHLARLRF